jgi:trehalose-6-phosphate synthase
LRHAESIGSGGGGGGGGGGGSAGQAAGVGSYAQALRLAKLFKRNGSKLVVSFDRLDWCQGLPQRLQALESFFLSQPHWRRRVTFFVVVRDPVGRADPELRQMVARLVGRVNGRFGLADYVPVYYVHQTLDHDQLVALYAVADALLVTSIREGLNLSAMEFVATQASHSDAHKVERELARACVREPPSPVPSLCCEPPPSL